MAPAVNRLPVSALVLSGGGAQAAYEVGVLKALMQGLSSATGYLPLEFGVVTGTSAGSVNAALLLTALEKNAGLPTDYMESVWLDDIADTGARCNNGVFRLRANPMNFTHPACFLENPIAPFMQLAQDSAFLTEEFAKRTVGFLLSDQKINKRALDFVDLSAFVSGDALKATLKKAIRLDHVRNSGKVLKISCTNWQTGMVRLFNNADMSDDLGLKIIEASSAIPGVFPAVKIEGELFVDGGIVMNTPLKPAIACGADVLHVIYTDPTLSRIPLPPTPNTANTVYRSLLMALCTIFKQDIDLAAETNLAVARLHGKNDDVFETGKGHRQITIHRYNPFQDHNVGWLNFEKDGLQQLIDLGFKDGVEHDCVRSRCVLPYQQQDVR